MMKIIVDVDQLEKDGILPPAIANLLRAHAVRQTGGTAINILLAFGAIAVAAGIMALVPEPAIGALMGLAFIGVGALIVRHHEQQWGKLGGIWMVVGTLILVGAESVLMGNPFYASLIGTLILIWGGVLARSSLLVALAPFSIAAAIGGSTGYWHACYMLSVEEPTITIALFSMLAYAAWTLAAKLEEAHRTLTIVFARICVVLVNFGFWVGSLWGDTPGHLWRQEAGAYYNYYSGTAAIAPAVFSGGWLIALVLAVLWGVKHHRRFMVNTAVVFAGIHLYTQWFEYFGLHPVTVILSGLAAIGLGLGLWRYNHSVLKTTQ